MPRQERERRLISEYMKQAFPEGEFQINVELGPIPKEYVTRMGYTKAAAMFRPTRPRVDAVKWGSDEYLLIEAKLRDIKSGIGDLLYYRNIIPETVDLPEFTGQPIKTRLVIPWMLDWLAPVAAANNIEVVIFRPDWIDGYIRERQDYFTLENRIAREDKKKLREVLGVD